MNIRDKGMNIRDTQSDSSYQGGACCSVLQLSIGETTKAIRLSEAS